MDNQIINCRCGRERRNKESNWSGLSVKIFLRLISPLCAHSWPLFLLNKTYKGSLYLLMTLEKSFNFIFALFFLLESSKLCPVFKPPFCLLWSHPLYVKGVGGALLRRHNCYFSNTTCIEEM